MRRRARMAPGILIALVLLSSGAPAAGPEKPRTIDLPIVAVTVFEDQALVERRGEIDLAKGASVLELVGIEPSLDPGSLAATGADPEVTVTSIQSRLEEVQASEDARRKAKALEDEADSLLDRILRLEDRRTAIQDVRELVTAYGKHAGEALSERTTGLAPLPPGTWERALAVIPENEKKLNEARFALSDEIEDLKEKRSIVLGNLSRLGIQARSKKTSTVTLNVDVPRSGKKVLALRYLAPDAGWKPVYDARVRAGGRTTLEYRALVAQRTGQDWVDASIQLSTSRPSAGVVVPELPPIEARAVGIEVPETRVVESKEEVIAAKLEGEPGAPPPPPEKPSEPTPPRGRPQEAPPAGPGAPPPIVTFRLRERMTVPADGSPRSVRIAEGLLEGTVQLYSAPGLRQATFRRLRTRNPFEQTILPGSVRIMGEAGLAGRTRLDLHPAGEPIDLFLGSDAEVRVGRRERLEPRTDSAFLTGRKTLVFEYELRAKNHKDEAVRLTLAERTPVSDVSAVQVHIDDETTKPSRAGDDGVLEWDLDLAPGEERLVKVGYRVEMPSDFDWRPN